ncbi:histidinol-phosphate transaminase, partial [Candidatus Cyanaurora vandensis]
MDRSRRIFLGAMGATAYGLQSRAWAKELVQGIGVPTGVVQILYNENPLGPSPRAIQAATTALAGTNRYPMMETVGLIRQLHNLHQLPFAAPQDAGNLGALFAALAQSQILLGVGSTELLRAVALAYGMAGGEFVEATPAYGEIGSAVEDMLPQVKRVLVPLLDYRHDLSAMARAITPQTRLVVVTNPNNPTGTAVSHSDLTRLADRLGPQALLLVDEAYLDFATDPGVKSAVDLALSRPNVLVTRTFSKVHGLAGLRVGYAVGSLPVIRKVRAFTMGLIASNSPAMAAATAALKDQAHLDNSRQLAIQARAQLMLQLPKFGITPVPSQANFVWAKTQGDCTALVKRLSEQGVLIAGGQRWDVPNHIRIS